MILEIGGGPPKNFIMQKFDFCRLRYKESWSWF